MIDNKPRFHRFQVDTPHKRFSIRFPKAFIDYIEGKLSRKVEQGEQMKISLVETENELGFKVVFMQK